MRRVLIVVCAVGAVCAGVSGSGRADPLTHTRLGPTPVLEWSVPPRYALSAGAWRSKTADYDTAYVRPKRWSATFDLCGSSGGGRPIVAYRLELAGVGFAYRSTSDNSTCLKRVDLPRLGPFDLTMSVRTSRERGASVTQRIEPRDYLIVSLGDSFASGEGSPDRRGLYNVDNPLGLVDIVANGGQPKVLKVADVLWQDRRCHRSGRAGHALLAKQIEEEDQHSSVTFVSLACSGATVYGGLLGPYAGQEPEGAKTPLVAQVTALRHLLGPPTRAERKVDAVLLQIGINDLEFADIILECASNLTPSKPNPVDDSDCVYDHVSDKLRDTPPPAKQAPENANLPTKYRKVGDAIAKSAPGAEVYVSDYPANVFHGGGCGLLIGIRNGEATAVEGTGGRMRAVLQQASVEEGWNYVGGTTEQMSGHSYCSLAPWFNGLLESFDKQGNKFGTAHPTPAGHIAFKDVLARGVVVKRAESPLFRVRLVIERVRLGPTPGAEEVQFDVAVPTRDDELGTLRRHRVTLARRGELIVPKGGPLSFAFDVYKRPQPGRYLTRASFVVSGLGCCGTLGKAHGAADLFGRGSHRIANPNGALEVEYRIELSKPGATR